MSGKRYPEEFKIEAVKQVVDRGYSVACKMASESIAVWHSNRS
ncbi:IS3 family transposase [Escherichia coli]|nr:IS3 family transposase [Escherichia coli]